MLIVWLLLGASSGMALDNGLARTPPMGWLSWLYYECNIDEDLIKRTADRMASDGYREAGYEYIIIDDCWPEMQRSPDGKLVADKKRFKSGIKALADYVHSKKLKFGIYQDIGTNTCQGYPGLQGHEKVDVETLVSWDIDYLKVDGCYSNKEHFDVLYPAFGKVLNESGRPVLYSCSWPAYVFDEHPNYTAIAQSCNIWRNFNDVSPTWNSLLTIMDYFGNNNFSAYAGPGQWNDPDMLVGGNAHVTVSQSQAQMAVWSILGGPLLMSTDLDTLQPEHKKVFLNKNVISVNQDKLGQAGKRITHSENVDIWRRDLENKAVALVFINRKTDLRENVEVPYELINISAGRYNVEELFNQEKSRVITVNDAKEMLFVQQINAAGVIMYKLSPIDDNIDYNLIS